MSTNKSTQPPRKSKTAQPKPNQQGSSKQRGLEHDSPAVRQSKTLSWILRHGAKSEGLKMRPDGYLQVTELLSNPRLEGLDLTTLQGVVAADTKQRYDLKHEPADDTWWIRANQGHSIKTIKVEMEPILHPSDVPMVVHGTNKAAWDKISQTGLLPMTRTHIHFAQSVHMKNAISGLRKNSQILIYIDLALALSSTPPIPFFLSKNGVVLSPGPIPPTLFRRVASPDWTPLPGFDKHKVQVYPGKGSEPIEVNGDEEVKQALGNELVQEMERLDVAGEDAAKKSGKGRKKDVDPVDEASLAAV